MAVVSSASPVGRALSLNKALRTLMYRAISEKREFEFWHAIIFRLWPDVLLEETGNETLQKWLGTILATAGVRASMPAGEILDRVQSFYERCPPDPIWLERTDELARGYQDQDQMARNRKTSRFLRGPPSYRATHPQGGPVGDQVKLFLMREDEGLIREEAHKSRYSR